MATTTTDRTASRTARIVAVAGFTICAWVVAPAAAEALILESDNDRGKPAFAPNGTIYMPAAGGAVSTISRSHTATGGPREF